MQYRYAGDLGDSLKFGLLRWLAPLGSPLFPRLGVIWYPTAGEAHNADGRHVAYLHPGHRSPALPRRLGPDLYERLAAVVASGQPSTAALANAGVPGTGTGLFDDLPGFADLPVSARAARQARRHSWIKQATVATTGCDLVFADPGNGTRTALHPAPAHRTKAVKHAYLSELAPFAQQGQSLVIYPHADRTPTVDLRTSRCLHTRAGCTYQAEMACRPITEVLACVMTRR